MSTTTRKLSGNTASSRPAGVPAASTGVDMMPCSSANGTNTTRGGLRFSSMAAVGWLMIAGMILSGAAGAAEMPSPLDRLNSGDRARTVSGLGHFETARINLWSAAEAPGAQLVRLDSAASEFGAISDPAARDYLMARVELYRGRIALTEESKSAARLNFETAMDLADRSNAVRESSEAWRVKADAGSSWMITKGLGGIIKMAPQVQQWSDRSVELDEKNALAIIISAQGQINAPKGAGGNPEEAVRRLELLNDRSDLDSVERFWARVSLSQAYGKLRRRDDAARLCASAREIFPASPMLEECD